MPANPFRLLQPDGPPPITSQQLLQYLETHVINLDTLLKDLKCTTDDVAYVLQHHDTADMLRLKVQLVSVQIRLLAAQYAPHAVAQLIHLSNTSEKPEVARRAATTLLHIAGIPTNTAPQPADPVTQLPPKPPFELTTELEEQQDAMCRDLNVVLELRRLHRVDFTSIPNAEYPRFATYIEEFLKSFPPKPKSPPLPSSNTSSQSPPAAPIPFGPVKLET